MDWTITILLLLGVLLGLMLIGLPVSLAFFGVNIVGALLFLGGGIGLSQLALNSVAAVANFSLSPIPLFILMGEVLFHSGVAFRAINAVERLIRKVPGRLSVVSLVGGTVFSTLSGSTMANTALLGSVLLPQKLERGYDAKMAMGPIMAVGGIAMLIPPSALAVLLGSLAGISISKLLIGGIVPALILSVLFLGYVILRCKLNPALAPMGEEEAQEQYSGWERWRPFVLDVLPLLLIFAVVIGGMIAGIATPTESAALGVAASVLAALSYRLMTVRALAQSLMETAKIAIMVLFIIAASTTFSQILVFSGATRGFLSLMNAVEWSPLVLVICMMLILLLLGAFMDQISMVMVTLPFFMPLAHATGIDLIWLGILILLAMEISLITPPFGLLLFVMKGVAPPGIRLMQVCAAAVPYIVLEIGVLALLVLFPAIALWLPSYM